MIRDFGMTDKGLIKMDYKIIELNEVPEIKERAAEWFHEKWGVPLDAYLDSMEDCLSGGLPRWYMAMDGEQIVGGCGIIANDFHKRHDLTPNLCALYVEEACRKNGIAGALLDFACFDMAKRGYPTLYLVTDHTSFYERYGWEFLCLVEEEWGENLTRMYIKNLKLL